jgi:DNA (cytosine-5)-methyltransferase 1
MIGVIAADPTILTGGADHIKTVLGVPDSIAELTVLTASTDGALDSGEDETAWDEPVLVGKGVLRVAARFRASEVDRRNRMTDGRIAIARMVGLSSKSREAQRNLIELANGICRPTQPLCHCCPLEPGCEKHLVDDDQLILW